MPPHDSRSTYERGRAGEARAVEYLVAQGYRILERNFRVPRGEVDIVAEHHGMLVSVEVKSWRGYDEADLEYAISARKRRRIVSATRAYLATHPELGASTVRFDVILLKADRVRHIRGAFDA